VDLPLELGGECLTASERRDKGPWNKKRRAREHKVHFEQATCFERLTNALNPV
jgi:hypothetical protein